MSVQVMKVVFKNRNFVDVLVVNGKNRALLSQVAIFGKDGKYVKNNWAFASFKLEKLYNDVIEIVKSTKENAFEVYDALKELNA